MKLFITIFSGVGVLMLSISGYLFFQESQFIQRAETGKGTVIALHRSVSSKGGVTYYPEVEFRTAQGQPIRFSSGFSSNPAAYDVGEEVDVYYEARQPQQAEIKGFFSQWFPVLITGIFGIIFGSIGFGMLGSSVRQKNRQRRLLQQGRRIEAHIQSVEQNTSLKINGKSPFVIYGQWLNPATNEVRVFKSESIWFNPSRYLSKDTIDVWLDERNSKYYYVDTSFLPKMQ